jgi:carboxyl-terminal processing protease
MNAIVLQFDPHSLYMRDSEKNKSDINISGKIVGIGARLVIKDEFIAIGEMAYGGPASNTKQIEVGDVILKVAEGDNLPISIIGLKLPEVTELMKGKLGTIVNLTLKKEDGGIKTISVKRDIIEFKDSYAKSCIVEKKGKKFGVIDLPKFYKDFDDENNRDAAKDVRGEIEFLKKDGINGIVIDLRNNGGGAVDTAIDITGLFIEKGPVVQIKSSNKTKEVLSDTKSEIVWDGPLVVLLNNDSASASEILAAAIQDYKRGIVMGGKQSYGKGTVQKTTDLDLYSPKGSEGNCGALKTTIKKIYRVSGSSTQLQGISSDIVMPDEFSHVKYGERDKDNAIAWDKIEALPYKKCNHLTNFENVVTASKKRIDESKYFYLIDQNAAYLSKKEQNTLVSLNVVKYKKALDENKEELERFAGINHYDNHLDFKSTAGELKLIQKSPSLGVKRKNWHAILIEDIYIDEALNVLYDLKNSPMENKKGKK